MVSLKQYLKAKAIVHEYENGLQAPLTDKKKSQCYILPAIDELSNIGPREIAIAFKEDHPFPLDYIVNQKLYEWKREATVPTRLLGKIKMVQIYELVA